MPSEYEALPYDVEEIITALTDYLDANMPTMIEQSVLAELYTLSDDLLLSADTMRNTSSLTPVLVKEFEIIVDGDFRIAFDIRKYTGTVATAYAQIYKNDVAVGTERSNAGTTWVNYSEDLTGWERTDKIQLYLWAGEGASRNAQIRNFRVYGLRTIGAVNTD